jgi:hypothetical protein
MIPISFCWDTPRRSFLLKWNGFISSGWENGKISIKCLGVSIPIRMKRKKSQLSGRFPIRWVYVRGLFSFLTKWRVKKIEGTLSFPDPMVNGMLYGWMSAFQMGGMDRKIYLTVNFLGENWCRGEVTLSLKVLFYHLKAWIFPLIREMRRKRSR